MSDVVPKLPTVWIVDDSPTDAQRAEKALANCYIVQIFTDGSALLEQLAGHPPPDVLVLDWVMPGISGLEVVEFLRSEKGRLPQVPVLLLTSHNREEQIVQGLSAGANDYLAKPYGPAELRARVDALIRSAQLLERALKAETGMKLVLANAPDALLAVDSKGVITFANDQANRTLSGTAQPLLGRELSEILPDLPVRNISLGPGESLLPLPDVKIANRIYSPTIRLLPDDTAANTTIALRDVTERRQAEERRLDFYSIIAHDLRSPLSAMMLRTTSILRGKHGPLSSELTADLRKFDASMRSMVSIINDFLELARLEGSGHKIQKEEVDLSSILENTIEELRPLLEAGKLQLEWQRPPDPLKVLGDKSRLRQVVSNLVGNAIKFTPESGRIVIHCENGGDIVETRITDTGQGIPPEAVPRLFERFTRGPSQSETVGSGLGLMIVRQIVEAHGGKVGVVTGVGQGSTFWFRLPKYQFSEEN